MRRHAVLVAALGLALTSCVGVYGPKGNDVGGIIRGRLRRSRTRSRSRSAIAASSTNMR